MVSLSANWTIPDLKEDFDSLINKFEMIKVTTAEVKAVLPSMHECFQYQTDLLEILTWVQELLVTLEAEFFLNDIEQIDQEIEKHEVSLRVYFLFLQISVAKTLRRTVQKCWWVGYYRIDIE